MDSLSAGSKRWPPLCWIPTHAFWQQLTFPNAIAAPLQEATALEERVGELEQDVEDKLSTEREKTESAIDTEQQQRRHAVKGVESDLRERIETDIGVRDVMRMLVDRVAGAADEEAIKWVSAKAEANNSASTEKVREELTELIDEKVTAVEGDVESHSTQLEELESGKEAADEKIAKLDEGAEATSTKLGELSAGAEATKESLSTVETNVTTLTDKTAALETFQGEATKGLADGQF